MRPKALRLKGTDPPDLDMSESIPTYEGQRPPYDTEIIYSTNDPGASLPIGWREVTTGVSQGSWAIVLFLLVIVWWAKKPLGAFVEKQLEVLDELKASLRQNSETLKAMSDTDRHVSAILEALQDRNKTVDTMLQDYRVHNDSCHEKTWSKLDGIDRKLGGPKP